MYGIVKRCIIFTKLETICHWNNHVVSLTRNSYNAPTSTRIIHSNTLHVNLIMQTLAVDLDMPFDMFAHYLKAFVCTTRNTTSGLHATKSNSEYVNIYSGRTGRTDFAALRVINLVSDTPKSLVRAHIALTITIRVRRKFGTIAAAHNSHDCVDPDNEAVEDGNTQECDSQ